MSVKKIEIIGHMWCEGHNIWHEVYDMIFLNGNEEVLCGPYYDCGQTQYSLGDSDFFVHGNAENTPPTPNDYENEYIHSVEQNRTHTW